MIQRRNTAPKPGDVDVCHCCGIRHRMAFSPFPLVRRSDGRIYCPYDCDGQATFSLGILRQKIIASTGIDPDAPNACGRFLAVMKTELKIK